MKNTNLLIGAGVVVVGYLLWKKSQSNSVAKSDIIVPENALVRPKITENIFTPKIITGSTNSVINPNNYQNAPRIINDITIDKLPTIVNQEDIQLFFFNNPNISSIEENTIRDARGIPIYTKLRKSDVKKDLFGNVVSGNANEGFYYKENGKHYLKTPTSSGFTLCEISQNDYIEFFVNIKEGSYKKIISPSIKTNNCTFSLYGGSWGR